LAGCASERRRYSAGHVRHPSSEALLGLAPVGVTEDGPFILIQAVASSLDRTFRIAVHLRAERRFIHPSLHELLERLATHQASPLENVIERGDAAGVPELIFR